MYVISLNINVLKKQSRQSMLYSQTLGQESRKN